MTNTDQVPTGPQPAERPDARLISLHAERGDAQGRLESALAALEGADWGLLLAGEAALAEQLHALLGSGVLRLDPRLPLRRDLLAEAGLAAAGLEGDWRGARAVWLLEPDSEAIARAQRAEVPVIVDATLAPGGHWPAAGATYVTYHHGAALTGFGGTELALLFGLGEAPAPAAAPAADLSAALALRDVATLPLRLARAAQTALQVGAQLQGRALPLGPTALLLPPDTVAPTAAPLGGVLPAARSVQGGIIVTPGLAGMRQLRQWLSSSLAPQPAKPAPQNRDEEGRKEKTFRREDAAAQGQAERAGRKEPERSKPAREERRPEPRQHERQQSEHWSQERPQERQQEQPAPSAAALPESAPVQDEDTQAGELERFVFEAPQPGPQERETQEGAQPQPQSQPQPALEPDPEPAALAPDLPGVPEGGDPAADLTEEQSAVFARLRDWRNAEAKRQGISRFIVASNATLAEIARQVPYTLDDLRAIRGMGPARLSKYGEAILQVVRGE